MIGERVKKEERRACSSVTNEPDATAELSFETPLVSHTRTELSSETFDHVEKVGMLSVCRIVWGR